MAGAAAFLLFTGARAALADAGLQFVHAPNAAGPPLQVALWYPTAAHASHQDFGIIAEDVAMGAPVDPGRHPLIVISHGNGGSNLSHDDTAIALAKAGFVVAAVMHTGDNYLDHANELRLQDRPPQLKATIDYALTSWSGAASIDPQKIGVFGFSAGGFTALVTIGGKPDLSLVPPYCDKHAQTFVCTLQKAHGPAQQATLPASVWIADPRVRAAVIAAPALGFTFTRAGLAGVSVPIQLWAAQDDHILPVADNAAAVRDALPQPPEYHAVPGADHFDFLAPCSAAMAKAIPPICSESGGFDRSAFHANFNDAVVRFFRRNLPPK